MFYSHFLTRTTEEAHPKFDPEIKYGRQNPFAEDANLVEMKELFLADARSYLPHGVKFSVTVTPKNEDTSGFGWMSWLYKPDGNYSDKGEIFTA